ncbi:MAG TPA: hypothetical protein VLF41_00060 [Candidatus Nanoarchaeia archaeon]|nr:hypothetical protein [Candidatus Nanoarchaeia archaeon]
MRTFPVAANVVILFLVCMSTWLNRDAKDWVRLVQLITIVAVSITLGSQLAGH